VAETTELSIKTLRLMSVAAIVNCALAALGVTISCYVYFYVPHPLDVHTIGKYGEVVSSTATYIFVLPVFQVWMFVVPVVGRWGRLTRSGTMANPTASGLRGRPVLLHAFQMLCPGCVAHGTPQTSSPGESRENSLRQAT
jgi:hypothetical protein